MKKLKIGLPKGSLQKATVELFRRAGYEILIEERSYLPQIDDAELEARLVRAQDMPRFVEEGILDAGLTGKDWILENRAQVVEVADLPYASKSLRPIKWVLAVPECSLVNKAEDLEGKRIATELVNVTRDYLKKRRVKAQVEFSWGATEVKAPELVDAIVELTETGASLKAHNLRIVDVVLESTTKLIANKEAWKDSWKRQKIENIAILLQGALQAAEKVGLKMNVPKAQLKEVLNILPALKKPTISHLSDKNWVAVESIVDEKVARDLIPKLKRAGAQGIVEYPLNKVIY